MYLSQQFPNLADSKSKKRTLKPTAGQETNSQVIGELPDTFVSSWIFYVYLIFSSKGSYNVKRFSYFSICNYPS